MELQITIPGDIDAVLTPNRGQRNPWAKDRAKAQAHEDARLCTLSAMHGVAIAGVDRATYHIERGQAKRRQVFDQDNCAASCKAFLDGIAKALGVDDRGWTLGTVHQTRDPEKIGYVRITLVWDQNEEQAA